MNDRYPLISIIIPVYNVEKYLRNCIDSVIRQSYAKWEMILIDDGSSDNSGFICDEYARKDSRILVIHKNNGGLSSARNAALDLPPHGDFVSFLDSDDYWHPSYLESLVELQIQYDADIVQCGFVRGTDNVFPSIKKRVETIVLDNHSVFLKEKARIIMCGKMYRIDLFDQIRMPVGLYNEDDWTTWKLYYRAKTIVDTSSFLYYYTDNPSSTMAKLKKKPDLRYWDAYNERIGFFIKEGKLDLEHCSRLQFCKSLILLYGHSSLSREDRRLIISIIKENWKVLRFSPYIENKYKFLLGLFVTMPKMSTVIANNVKRG